MRADPQTGVQVLRDGTLVEVNEHGKAEFLTCGCGLRLKADGADGQICAAGHEFGNAEAPYGAEWTREHDLEGHRRWWS